MLFVQPAIKSTCAPAVANHHLELVCPANNVPHLRRCNKTNSERTFEIVSWRNVETFISLTTRCHNEGFYLQDERETRELSELSELCKARESEINVGVGTLSGGGGLGLSILFRCEVLVPVSLVLKIH